MGLIALNCKKCGAGLQVEEHLITYSCSYCRTVHEREPSKNVAATPNSLLVLADRAIGRKEFGKAMQFIEQGLTMDPHNSELLALEKKAQAELDTLAGVQLSQVSEEIKKIDRESEAEQLHGQAMTRLIECQSYFNVYGTQSAEIRRKAQDGMEFIDAALRLSPNNPAYLNVKALLYADGLGQTEIGLARLQLAGQLAPKDIQIQQNIRALTYRKERETQNRAIKYIVFLIGFFLFIAFVIFMTPIIRDIYNSPRK